MTKKIILLLACVSFLLACSKMKDNYKTVLPSPDTRIHIYFNLNHGEPYYMVYYRDEEVLNWSPLGFILKGNDSLVRNFVITGSETASANETWKPVWGQFSSYTNNYNQLTVSLQEKEKPNRKIDIIFRAYDDGIAFRYEFPEQETLKDVEIQSEETAFRINTDGTAWWEKADWDSYEHLYNTTPVSAIDSANVPVTIELNNGVFISIHEANLTDYAGMTLIRDKKEELKLNCNLVPWPDGIKVKTKTPFCTPWRTVQVADSAGKLIESGLILNLNEPNKLTDVSWIKPTKFVGIWWGMHLGVYTWSAGNRHGATTERAKQYINFAADHNIGAVLVEGWNTGWESWFKGDNFDFITPYPDYNLKEVADYAKEKGIALIGHDETGGQVPLFEKYIDTAFALYQSLGIHAVKTGYAGKIRPEGQHHHGQWMVNHYRMVVEKAASHKIMVDAHEPIEPTGIERTWPNMMTREGSRGMEYNAWSDGNPPEHTTILPFTRILAGPMDYTPGIFDIKCENYKKIREKYAPDNADKHVHTTLAKQLALYVVLFSPMQMAADMIENYKDQPAFEFIEKVPVSWDETKVLNAKIGDYVTIARKNGENWYIGGITDENARKLSLHFDFLNPDKKYTIKIFEDGENADYETNPLPIKIYSKEIANTDELELSLARGGGFAAIIEAH